MSVSFYCPTLHEFGRSHVHGRALVCVVLRPLSGSTDDGSPPPSVRLDVVWEDGEVRVGRVITLGSEEGDHPSTKGKARRMTKDQRREKELEVLGKEIREMERKQGKRKRGKGKGKGNRKDSEDEDSGDAFALSRSGVVSEETDRMSVQDIYAHGVKHLNAIEETRYKSSNLQGGQSKIMKNEVVALREYLLTMSDRLLNRAEEPPRWLLQKNPELRMAVEEKDREVKELRGEVAALTEKVDTTGKAVIA